MMMHTRFSARTLAGVTALAALAAAFLLPGAEAAAVPRACGLTTVEGTVRATSAGLLRCGPGDPIHVRADIAKPTASRASTRQAMLAFMALGDMHITDEESPLRAEGADACVGEDRVGSFRPHEALLPQLVNAHIKAAAALASSGSPRLGKTFDFAVQLGDAADNKQFNETRWAIDLLDGGTVVDPDSGKDGYEGSQTRDPQGGSAFRSPVTDRSLLELANEPFVANGLRTGNGLPLPWYAVLGSHDAKVQGILEDNDATREAANAVATGQLKLSSLDAEQRARLCKDPTLASDPNFLAQALADPTSPQPKLVTADPDRRVLSRADWAAEHSRTRGLPAGHGLAAGRCTDAQGTALARLCYSWDHGPFHLVALDTVPSEAGEDGNLDAAQFAWLERDLKAASSKHFDEDGSKKSNTVADRLTIVFSHHAPATMTNTGRGSDVRDGAALEKLLLRFPNVILHVNGSTHQDKVIAHESDANKTAYWEINAGSIADWPTRSRSIEIADNHDGTLSIFGLQFEAAAEANARSVSWREDDSTSEKRAGADANINEDWLAAAAREIALNDPQAPSSSASAKNRNVELLLPHPLGVTTRSGTPPPLRPFAPFFPGPPSGFAFPPNLNGFPGGFDQNFQNGLTPPPAPSFPGVFNPTGKGLPIRPGAANAMTARVLMLIIAAGAGGYWLLQARVRRWMVGI